MESGPLDSVTPLIVVPIRPEGIRVLGVPFGKMTFVHGFMLAALSQYVLDIDQLVALRDVQIAFMITV